MALFQELNRDGITIMVVTHEPDIAGYASRVVTFRDGTVRFDQSVSRRTDAKEILAKGVFGSSINAGREVP